MNHTSNREHGLISTPTDVEDETGRRSQWKLLLSDDVPGTQFSKSISITLMLVITSTGSKASNEIVLHCLISPLERSRVNLAEWILLRLWRRKLGQIAERFRACSRVMLPDHDAVVY